MGTNEKMDEDDEIIALNVGGVIFTTTRETLTKGDTMLKNLFSGQFKMRTKDGIPFIDRDGSHFRIILNFLRSGKFVPPTDRQTLHEVLLEADYYGIKDLTRLLEDEVNKSESKVQFCKVICNSDWVGQLNYLVSNGWDIFKFMSETESKYRELDDYGKPLKNGIGWYDVQTQVILLKKPIA